jgi:hypothetical protein
MRERAGQIVGANAFTGPDNISQLVAEAPAKKRWPLSPNSTALFSMTGMRTSVKAGRTPAMPYHQS